VVYFEKVRQALEEKNEQKAKATSAAAITDKLNSEIRQLEAQVSHLFIPSRSHPIYYLLFGKNLVAGQLFFISFHFPHFISFSKNWKTQFYILSLQLRG